MIASHSLRGIACMLLATGAFVSNDTLMKLAMADMPPIQVLFMRGIAGSLWCLPLILILGQGSHLARALNPWVVVRALLEVAGVVTFVLALRQMPIADITAIFQIAPLLVLAGASLLWGEQIGRMRLACVALGISGALLVAQPGGEAATPYAVLGFATALSSAARDLVGRKIPHDLPVLVVAFTTIVITMLLAGFATLALEDWLAPEPRHYAFTAGAGFLLPFGHLFILLAFRLASAATVAPFYYTFTLWAVLSGLLVFGDVPNALAVSGMLLILLSGLSILVLDGRQRRLAAPAS